MTLIFSQGTERLEKYVTETPQAVIFKHINRNVLNTRLETPLLTTIMLRNDLTASYERMLALMDKFYGKSGRGVILSLVIRNDMGRDHVKNLWPERSVGISSNILVSIETSDEKYIRFFLDDPKFLRLAKKEFAKKYVLDNVKKNAMRLIELGFEYPKFSKVMSQLYAATGDDVFLIAETRGIFLF